MNDCKQSNHIHTTIDNIIPTYTATKLIDYKTSLINFNHKMRSANVATVHSNYSRIILKPAK